MKEIMEKIRDFGLEKTKPIAGLRPEIYALGIRSSKL
jgi:hypothetical protein